VAVKDHELEQARIEEIATEIDKLLTVNCVDDLCSKLKKFAQTKKIVLPYLKKLHHFAHFKADDVLATRDIDDAFREAAYLSQLVRESPEISPLEENQESDGQGALPQK